MARKKTKTLPRKSGGRPAAEIDLDQLEAAAEIGCTLEEIAALLGICKRTLQRRKDEPEIAEALERGQAKGRGTLRRWQWDAARSGNVTAQIWLGKQILGQRSYERPDPDAEAPAPPNLVIQTYDDSPDEAPEPRVQQSGALPRAGSG